MCRSRTAPSSGDLGADAAAARGCGGLGFALVLLATCVSIVNDCIDSHVCIVGHMTSKPRRTKSIARVAASTVVITAGLGLAGLGAAAIAQAQPAPFPVYHW
jgi:NAD(P)H-hydrate repair Nnr-like enzyme with NAD(P)H-hydrate dehydratase domain